MMRTIMFIENIFNGGVIDWTISIIVGILIISSLVYILKYLADEDERVKKKMSQLK